MNTKIKVPRWSGSDVEEVIERVRSGLPVKTVAKIARRSTKAVYTKLAREAGGVCSVRDGLWKTISIATFAKLFGISLYKAKRWIKVGVIKVRPKRRVKGEKTYIHDTAIRDFISDWRTWMLWNPDDITDPLWKAFAKQQRSHVNGKWLTIATVASLLNYSKQAVGRWVLEGRLFGKRWGRKWYVWSSNLDNFTPPLEDARPRQCKYCGKEVTGRKGLTVHLRRCKLHVEVAA